MTANAAGSSLVERQGWTGDLDATVVGCTWVGNLLAVTDGEGRISWIDPRAPALEPRTEHDGAILSAVATERGTALITGGDDGRVVRHLPESGSRDLLHVTGRWIEHLALSSALGLGVAAAGKEAIVFDVESGVERRRFAQPSTIGGLAIDPKGRRVAAAHYGGVTQWWLGIEGGNPRQLEWQGSHLAVTWSPTGRFIVTSMQEPALHGWRLDDGADMRMSGYVTKTRAFSWSVKGRWLATGGAVQAVCWPFSGGSGPMGKHPLQRGEHGLLVASSNTSATGSGGETADGLVTQVVFHPKEDVLATGYSDGCVELIRLADGSCIGAVPPNGEPITVLAWDHAGSFLASGGDGGRVALVRIAGSDASAKH